MDEKTKEIIYKSWKQIEDECKIDAQIIPQGGGNYLVKEVTIDQIDELKKFRSWVFYYCFDLLTANDQYDLARVNIKNINCTCFNLQCAKCLSVNCTDDNCYFHTITAKERFKRTYHK